MGRKPNSQPSYLLHKPSGQARVRIDGVDVYLGPYDSEASRQKYYQKLAERFGESRPIAEVRKLASGLTIAEFLKAYKEFADGYYGKDSGEHYRINNAIRPLKDLYGLELAKDVSPLKLQTVLDRLVFNGDMRKEIIAKGYRTISRTTVNDYLTVIKRIFQWGVSQELIPVSVYQAIATVNGIRKGRGKLAAKTHDPKKVQPVPQADYEAVLAKGRLSDEIKAMLELQNLTGMRPGEVTIMRPCDIDQKARPCWIYSPTKHKNDWREGMEVKEVVLGPRAQKLLKPWIKKCKRESDFLFSPKAVVERWNAEQIRMTGKDPAFVKLNAIKPPRQCYDEHSYRQAVVRGCRRAKVKIWTPNRLRHSVGTKVRAKYGAEAAKTVLGHRFLNTTEMYAEKDRQKYIQIMRKLG